jgi:hypothetical protein
VANHRHHWFAWVACGLGVFFGNLGSWFSGGVCGADPQGILQTAKLLRSLGFPTVPGPAK